MKSRTSIAGFSQNLFLINLDTMQSNQVDDLENILTNWELQKSQRFFTHLGQLLTIN